MRQLLSASIELSCNVMHHNRPSPLSITAASRVCQCASLPPSSCVGRDCRALLGQQFVVSGNPMSVLLTENMLHFKGKLVVPTQSARHSVSGCYVRGHSSLLPDKHEPLDF